MNLTALVGWLKGRKTYFTIAIGVLYVGGCFLGFYEFDEKVLAVLGLGALAFLRAGLKKPDLPVQLLAAGLAAALLCGGCATTNKSGRILATSVQAVDAAMQGWAAYVATGQATPRQEAQVRTAYGRYQLAEQAAEKAYVAAAKLEDQSIFTLASGALTAAQTDLLTLIASFSLPK